MFGRPATPRYPRFRTALARIFVLGFVVLLSAAIGLKAGAQPTKIEDIEKNTKALDPNNPVPADGPRKQPLAKYVLDTKKRIFHEIEDFKDVASEAQNASEYLAWTETVMKAAEFTVAELEEQGVRDLTVFDLIKPVRTAFRGELLRFEGKAVCIRRLAVPKFFEENPQLEITELYEVRFVPLNESPLTPISLVFLKLPDEFASVREQPIREWVDLDHWITAAGYYFKTMSVRGEEGKILGVPVLVGKSVTPRSGPPVPPGDNPIAIDPNVRIYKFIRDDSGMIRTTPTDSTWPEVAAYQRFILHASRFPAEELEAHALRDVRFADLFQDVRRDYQFKCVKFEGRLISLRRIEVNDELRAAGIETLFEGWLVPANEPRGFPVCIVFTEPLEGVEPTGQVDRWVSFAGFSFKLMRYESGEKHEEDAKGYKVKRAPLLIGKGPIPRPDPDAPSPLTWSLFGQVVLAVCGVLILAALGLTWWYRSTDRQAKLAANAARGGNPFDPNSQQPVS